MDERSDTNTSNELIDAEIPFEDSPFVEETSTKYLGRWNLLVSTTNWEKGRIICEWQEELVAAGTPAGSRSDEAWSRRVGNVSPQHTGRLRRVFQRFGEVNEQYAGLYWSHFQIALDWPDAEMWLEGAVQNGWSVARMRDQRWETLGETSELNPLEEEVVAADLDEDAKAAAETIQEPVSGSLDVVQDAEAAKYDEFDAEGKTHEAGRRTVDDEAVVPFDEATTEPTRPFENLPPLPADLNEAFEAFKLAVLHHRLSGWQDVSLDDVLATLDALKELALAPADD